MSKRKYTHVQELLPEIQEMIAGGKTQREVANILGLQDKYVVKRLLKRERNKMRKIESGIVPRPKGRPRKDSSPRDMITEQQYEINRLKAVTKVLSTPHKHILS